METNGDFVCLPKELEEFLIQPKQDEVISKISTESPKENDLKNDNIGNEEKKTQIDNSNELKTDTEKETVVKKTKVPRQGDERFYRITKLALLLAKNDAFNDKFEIRGKDGEFVKGTDLIKFLKIANQRSRKIDFIKEYAHQVSKLDCDLSSLINNQVILKYIEEEAKNNIPDKVDQIVQTDDVIIDEKSIQYNSKKPQKRKSDSGFWTSDPPKKGKLIEDKSLPDNGNMGWDLLPDLNEEIAKLFPDLK